VTEYRRWSIRTGMIVGLAVTGLLELLNGIFDFGVFVFGGVVGGMVVQIRNYIRFGSFGRDADGL
jgi:hypothetical protein